MSGTLDLGWWGVALAIVAGAIRVSTPYLLVSLGETLTEKSGRVNLGLEGTLVLGAMSGFAASYLTGSPWLGLLAAGISGAAMGLLHAVICNLPRINDIAVGIALFIFGIGLAFYLGKPFIEPRAPMLPAFSLGSWSGHAAIRSAFDVSPLFFIGIALALALEWGMRNTRWGLILRMAGESADAARAIGRSVERIRTLATVAGGFLSGVGGGFLGMPRMGASVLPGAHRLDIRVANYGLVRVADTACGSMPFTSEAGQTYRLTIDRGALFLMNSAGGAIVARTPLGDCPVTAQR